MKYAISNIEYDADHVELPSKLVITLSEGLSDDEIEHEVSEFISSETGFCHKGFSLEKIA